MTTYIRDTRTVFLRELRPMTRDPFSLIFSLLQPLVFLGLFGPLLVANSGEPASVVLQSFVPGILVMIALFGTGTTGSNLLFEIQTGSHERSLVMPIARSTDEQAAVIAIVTIPFGFSVNPVGLLIGLVLLSILGLGIGALSYSLALASRDNDWMFWGIQQATLFPLLILSGMLLPLDNGPTWMQVAAGFNPLSYVVTAERALLAGDLGDLAVLWGFAAAIILAAVGLTVGIRAMTRSN